MKKLNSLLLILVLIFNSCSNYKKLSETEISNKDFTKNYASILESEKNIVSIYDLNLQYTKLIYIDKKGFWNEVKLVNNQYKKSTYKQFQKFKISDSEMTNITNEIREINSNVKYLTDTAYVKLEFVSPEISRPVYYENGNVKNFKKENFSSQYLKTVQKILDLQ